jgi:hypothetical protein
VSSRKKVLLVLMSLLVSIKFILQPILDWQDEEMLRLNIEQRRIHKLTNASQRLPQLELQLVALRDNVSDHKRLFFEWQPSERFKLEKQQLIEGLLSRMGLDVQRLGWGEPIEYAGGQVIQYRAELEIKGELPDMIKWHVELEKLMPIIQVNYFSFRKVKGYGNRANNISANIQLDFYALNSEARGE